MSRAEYEAAITEIIRDMNEGRIGFEEAVQRCKSVVDEFYPDWVD